MMRHGVTASQAGHPLLLGLQAVMLSLRLHLHYDHLLVHAHLRRPEKDETPAQKASSVTLDWPCNSGGFPHLRIFPSHQDGMLLLPHV